MRKKVLLNMLSLCWLVFCTTGLYAQEQTTIIAPTTEAGEDLDIQAVGELFKQAETVEAFEEALNDPDNQVNNLDLNEDGEVDFITVQEYVDGDVHVLILRVPLSDDEFQDVASIEIEKIAEDDVRMQVVGDPEIYGENYILEPAPASTTVRVHVHTWPAVRLFWKPLYRPWRSPWRWRHYPPRWRPWRPVARVTYRSNVVRWHRTTYRTVTVRHSFRARSVYITQRKTTNLARKKNRKTAAYHNKKTTKKTRTTTKTTKTTTRKTNTTKKTTTTTKKTTTTKTKKTKTTQKKSGVQKKSTKTNKKKPPL